MRDVDPATWNAYVARHGPRLLSHRAEWEQVFNVYGLPVIRLAAYRENRIQGVLPLVWQRSVLFGNRLVSLPWLDSAGVLADDADVARFLVARAVELAKQRNARTVQLRRNRPIEASLPVRTDKFLMRLALESDLEPLWGRLGGKVRNHVRKAEKSGLTVQRGGRDLLREFFQIYSANMRDLGSPSHSRRFFETVLTAFRHETAVYVVRMGGRPVSAGWTMSNGDALELPWSSSLKAYRRYCGNYLLHWRILQDACREGYRWFHFGRSSVDSGPYQFKKQWGAEAVQLYWYYLPTDTGQSLIPGTPQNGYGWATRIWGHLPVWLTRSLGPYVISKVP